METDSNDKPTLDVKIRDCGEIKAGEPLGKPKTRIN